MYAPRTGRQCVSHTENVALFCPTRKKVSLVSIWQFSPQSINLITKYPFVPFFPEYT